MDAGPHQPGNTRRRFFVYQPRRIDWWATAVQLAGTLFFNVSTGNALRADLTAQAAHQHVWRPDAIGSVCFLVASALPAIRPLRATAGNVIVLETGTGRASTTITVTWPGCSLDVQVPGHVCPRQPERAGGLGQVGHRRRRADRDLHRRPAAPARDGLELVEPGLVRVQQWRPASELEARSPGGLWGGVGRKK